MASKIELKELKYGVRQRYLALCARTMSQPDWATFYESVANGANVSARRIQRITLAKREQEITASETELDAFAQVLECSTTDLAAEAAERVVAV